MLTTWEEEKVRNRTPQSDPLPFHRAGPWSCVLTMPRPWSRGSVGSEGTGRDPEDLDSATCTHLGQRGAGWGGVGK